jgi:hypothetical protein
MNELIEALNDIDIDSIIEKCLSPLQPGICPQHAETSHVGKIASNIKASVGQVKEVAAKYGSKAFNKLPKKVQEGISNTYALGKKIGHYAETSYRVGRQMALEVAKERGGSPEHIERVGRIVGNADLVLGWTVNFPLATAITGSPLLGKVSSWLPVASAGYIAYSLSRNPIKTIRASARSLAGKGMKETQHKAVENKQQQLKRFTRDIYDRLAEVPNPDWYEALLVVALDITHDAKQAIAMADEAYKETPEEPNDKDI